jgi:hypothetical protein
VRARGQRDSPREDVDRYYGSQAGGPAHGVDKWSRGSGERGGGYDEPKVRSCQFMNRTINVSTDDVDVPS